MFKIILCSLFLVGVSFGNKICEVTNNNNGTNTKTCVTVTKTDKSKCVTRTKTDFNKGGKKTGTDTRTICKFK